MANETMNIVIKYRNKYILCNDKDKANKIMEDLKEISKEAIEVETKSDEEISKLENEGKIYSWEFYMHAETEERDYGFAAYCHHCGERLGGYSRNVGRRVVECECGVVNVIENPYDFFDDY
jgi:hypothetical protein